MLSTLLVLILLDLTSASSSLWRGILGDGCCGTSIPDEPDVNPHELLPVKQTLAELIQKATNSTILRLGQVYPYQVTKYLNNSSNIQYLRFIVNKLR